MTDSTQVSPGQRVVLNGKSAEVIRTRTVGDIQYLRVYIEQEGVKTVCLDDVEVHLEDTREREIFELLQTKLEEIRSKLGNTADVLGTLDDIDVDSLIMESIQHDEPPSATKEELEELIEERQQTLEEWYERSLVETSTFDAESRRQIQEVVDDSEDVYGSEADIRTFFERAVTAFGGDFEQRGTNLYQAELPAEVRPPGIESPFGPFTFDRDFAMEHDDITYIAPDSEVLQRLMTRVLDDDRGEVGLKLLPFVDSAGITYNYRVAFEDGTGAVIREETIPVFVDADQMDAQQALGERVIEGDSVSAKPDVDDLRRLVGSEDDLRTAADRYVNARVSEIKSDLKSSRHEETTRELENLNEYAQAERERIESFIEEYERKSEAGSDRTKQSQQRRPSAASDEVTIAPVEEPENVETIAPREDRAETLRRIDPACADGE